MFTKDAIERHIYCIRTTEEDALRLRSHPYELFPSYEF